VNFRRLQPLPVLAIVGIVVAYRWAEFMRQCHERGLPAEVLEDLAKLERDRVEDENQDDEDDDGTTTTDDV